MRTRIIVALMCVAVGVLVWSLWKGRTGTDTGPAPTTVELVQADGLPPAQVEADQLINWAEQTLAGECMVKHGFRYAVQWKPSGPPVAKGTKYGNDDLAWAEAHGFGMGEIRGSGENVRDVNRAYVESLPDNASAAFSKVLQGDTRDMITIALPGGGTAGVSKAGCLSGARVELFGDLSEWLRLDTFWRNLDIQVMPKVTDSEPYKVSLEAWRKCMADKAWTATSPGGLRDEIAKLYGGGRPTEQALAEEKRAARDEATCAGQTGLVRGAEEADAALREKLRADHAADLKAYQEMQQRAQRRASELLVRKTAEAAR